ncbi:dynein axonemal assembly factor 3-like isoform X2 [Anomalospiza imberbis]|uniref:dynein axonemal assembly factor 3-like isoform X2 n=1 Tax=Anomalospiza imberbis TaxID=187417 RepID=UPI00358E2E15
MAAALEEAVGTVCWWGLSPAIDLRLHREPRAPPAARPRPGAPGDRAPLPVPAVPADPEPAAEASVLLVGAAEGRHLLLTAARARRGPPRAITLFVAEQSPEPVARQLLFLLLALEAPERPRPAARAAAILELLGSGSLRAGTAALLRGAAGRLRRWLGSDRHRDGHRDGPADLSLMKATSVSPAEFGRWRESGDAFGGGGATPNPTVLSDPRPRATATELSLAAVTALLHELLTGDPPPEERDPPPEERDPPPGDPPGERDPPCEDSSPLGSLAPLPLRVRFLPLGGPPATPARLGGLCQLLVLGWRALPALSPALGALAAPGATLLLELPTFVPTLRPPELGALRARAAALARAGGFEPWGGPGEPPAHARFRRAPPH